MPQTSLAIVALLAFAATLEVASRHSRLDASTDDASFKKAVEPVSANNAARKSQHSAQHVVSPARQAIALSSAEQNADNEIESDDMLAHLKATLVFRQTLQAHQKFLDSVDEPGWSRPTEQSLSAYLVTELSVGALQLQSVMCRATACEIQVLGLGESAGVGDLASKEWASLTQQLSAVPWNGMFETTEMSIETPYEDRIVFATILKRRLNPLPTFESAITD